MLRSQLIQEHPRLYHMAEDGAWTSIQRRGLLSTRAIVDLCKPDEGTRAMILNGVRRRGVDLYAEELGTVRIRDQLPLKFLDRCLKAGTTRQQFLDELNGRVFFWLSIERLRTLLGASQYRNAPHTVLTVDTAQLLREKGDLVQLAPYNTGSVHVPTAPARGIDVFVDVDQYPYDTWRAQRGPAGDAVVELTLPYSVPDIAKFVISVERWRSGEPIETIYRRTVESGRQAAPEQAS